MITTLENEPRPLETMNKIYWLKRGVNSFGMHARNTIQLPKAAGVLYAGIFFLKNTSVVVVRVNPLAAIKSNARCLDNSIVFSPTKNISLLIGRVQLSFVELENKVGVNVRLVA